LLSEERIRKKGKKLPPLQAINRKTKKGNLQDLSLVKAPILQMDRINRTDEIVQKQTSRNLNETESEIDIKESFNWRKEDKAPSYNPQLLQRQAQQTEDVLFSMQSKEFADEGYTFTRPNNERTNDDDEYNNLMRDLADDEPSKKQIKRPNASNFVNKTKVVHQQRNVQAKFRKNSSDSFEELMDGFNQSGKPKFLPKKQPRHNNANKEFDDFDFTS
jgi:glutamate synthase domain-containing protein 2